MTRIQRHFLSIAGVLGMLLLSSGSAVPSESAITPAKDAGASANGASAEKGQAVHWDARTAEHLLNRAGFGGTSADVQKLVDLGLDKAVDSFFPEHPSVPAPEILGRAAQQDGLESPESRLATVGSRRSSYSRLQPDLILPLNRFADWWIERMIQSEDPLRDRMALFWHGHFVSSVKDVGNSQDMIRQLLFLRDNALGSFETLVRGIGRDPAMLRYLNNDTNVKDHPNENWARELMELFSLGDGNYTETDIKEAARAFTGWSRGPDGFEYKRLDHDFGPKHVLAVNGNLDGDAVIGVVLEQPACARFVARKILAHFEGVAPDEARLADYADFLRKNGYDIGRMMKRLLKDPAFYRDEVIGTRVVPPVEYLVSSARRLGIDPPGQMVLNAGDLLGQRLFWCPSVKGWEDGLAWITTASMMQRSNMIGVMLGIVEVDSLMHDDEFGAPEPAGMEKRVSRTNGFNQLRFVQACGWQPALSMTAKVKAAGKSRDEEIVNWMVNDLLAIPYSPDIAREPYDWLHAAREKPGSQEGGLADAGDKGETILRELAHLILSLPEAQVD
jgi:uncharacterized protein (DUF1800 family)